MKKRTLPSQKILLDLLSYDEPSGRLFWNSRPLKYFQDDAHMKAERRKKIWDAKHSGKEAFTSGLDGYLCGGIFGKIYLAHRVIWKIKTGTDPDIIDHANGIRTYNKFSNLTSGTMIDNAQNVKRRHDNSSGIVGVYKIKSTQKWQACIGHKRKLIYLGVFNKIEDAIAARAEAEIRYNFHQNHGRAE